MCKNQRKLYNYLIHNTLDITDFSFKKINRVYYLPYFTFKHFYRIILHFKI